MRFRLKKLKTVDYFLLASCVFFIYWIVSSLNTGQISLRGSFYHINDSPGGFWFSITVCGLLAVVSFGAIFLSNDE
jgi:hypothetical protein